MKARSRLPIVAVISVPISLFGLAGPSGGYDLGTHREIAVRAVEVSGVDQVLREQLGLSGGARHLVSGREVRELLGEGALTEDVPVVRVLNHFHDPLKPWESAGLHVLLQLGQSSVLWQQNPDQDGRAGGGRWSWQDARRHHLAALTAGSPGEREQAFADTFLALGHLSHLVQDASVPAHVRNDPHLVRDGYEAWVEAVRTSADPGRRAVFDALLASPPVVPPRSIFVATDDARAPVPVARLLDRDVLAGPDPAPLTGTVLGIAEYTQGNFLSDDTIFRDFGLPRPQSLGTAFLEAEGRGLRRYFPKQGEGETVEHFVAEGVWSERLRFRGRPERGDVLTDRVYQDYAARLLPRAVGYSAALLDYFFRGRLELAFTADPADADASFLTAVNRSAEPIGPGVLTLYTDAADGGRAPVPGAALPVTAAVPPDQPLPPLRVPRTVEGQRLTAVYRGRLGHEADAVIGEAREGVEVEQIFRGATDWMLRTADGVFPLGLGPGPGVVKWGDRDNTLLAETFLGGRDVLVQGYRINRAEGSRGVPLKAGPNPQAPPVVDLVPLGGPVTLATPIDLGTRVTYTRSEDYEQHLVTIDAEFWLHCGNPCSVLRKNVAGVTSQTPAAQVFGFTKTFPLVVDVAPSRDAPYTWFVDDVFLNRDGDVLALIEVRLTTPPLIPVPIWRHDARGVLGPSGETAFVVLFSPSPHVFFFVVNLSQRRVVAKSCQDTVALTFRTTNHFAVADVHALVHGWIGPEEQWLAATASSDGNVLGAPITSVEDQQGVTQWDLSGLHRPELAAAGFATAPGILTDVTTFPAAILDPIPHDPEEDHTLAVVEMTRTVFDVDPGAALAITDVLRSSAPEEGYTILGWWDSHGVERWRPFRWVPLGARLVPLPGLALPADLETSVSLVGANRGSAMFRADVTLQPSRERVRTTRLVTARQEVTIAGDVTPGYRLLEPDWLYGVGDLRFHRLTPGLEALPLPRPLVAGPAEGAYHVIGAR